MELASFRKLSSDASELDEAASHLFRGGIVAFPTETVYGLGANASKQAAIASLYDLKQRPVDHPLIIHVAGLSDASSWAKLNPLALKLIGALWPGALTLILPRRPGIPMHALAKEKTVALRCPSHPVARSLLSKFSALGGKGVAAPSANPYGRLSPTHADDVETDLRQMMQAHATRRIRLSDPQLPACWLIEGGESDAGIESTVLDLSTEQPRVLRPGVISREQLESVLGLSIPLVKVSAPDPKEARRASLGKPKASGTHLSHYAPGKPFYVIDQANQSDQLALLHEQGLHRLALWGSESGEFADEGFDVVLNLGALPDGPQAVGQVLYRQLRVMDQSEAQALIMVLPEPLEVLGDNPAWEALVDRLERAVYATKHGLLKPQSQQAASAKAMLEATAQSQSLPIAGAGEFDDFATDAKAPVASPAMTGDASADAMDFDMSFDDFGSNP